MNKTNSSFFTNKQIKIETVYPHLFDDFHLKGILEASIENSQYKENFKI